MQALRLLIWQRLLTSRIVNYQNITEVNSYSKCFQKETRSLCLKNHFPLSPVGQLESIRCICHPTESSVSSLNDFTLKRTFSSTSLCKREENFEQSEDDLLIEPHEEKIFQQWSRELLHAAGVHSVLVIQPYIKWGSKKKRNTTPELQLEESVALVQSLHGWIVVDKMMIGLISFARKTFFGSGNFETLRRRVRSDERTTAVFISTKMLWSVQRRELQHAFGLPVFDRYTIIIHLFRQHAVTREAKLQVAMAEIPYMWSQLKGRDGPIDKRSGVSGSAHGVGGGGETINEIHKQVLANRESKIKQALVKLRNHRMLLRTNRKKMEYPIVAVVGYTNAGKTSLIKALTGDESMQPKNRLFATLDISNHMGLLPSQLKILYVDTIGFISDIPTNLLESFVATLEDAMFADVIVHVRDVSHPDRAAQAENVNSTLQSLHLPPNIIENIIVVGNKIDLVDSNLPVSEDDGIPVSAVENIGLNTLKKRIEETILQVTGRTSLVIRVPMGAEETSWLYKEATVTYTEADPDDSQFLLMHVIITEAQLNRFKHQFIKKN